MKTPSEMFACFHPSRMKRYVLALVDHGLQCSNKLRLLGGKFCKPSEHNRSPSRRFPPSTDALDEGSWAWRKGHSGNSIRDFKKQSRILFKKFLLCIFILYYTVELLMTTAYLIVVTVCGIAK